jgi:hypothetical protein
MGKAARAFLALFLSILCGGCATFEYDVVQPAEMAQRVTADADTVIVMQPIEYHLQADSGRLVMRIFNRADDSVQLMGDKSVVVDPQGQSHPLHGQAIAPGSFVREILPPFPPTQTQPNFGVGVGIGISRGDEPGYILPRGYNEPSRIDVIPDSAAYFWEWDGETQVRLNLVYEHGDRSFEHHFVFRRIKK